MMKTCFQVIFASCVFAPALALAGEVVSQQHTIDEIRYIEAGNTVEVELRQGDTPLLVAEATEEVLGRVTVNVEGDRLKLGVQKKEEGFWGWFKGNKDEVKFVVQAPQPLGLVLYGASKARVTNIETPEFTLNTSGASQARFEKLTVNTLEVAMSGASYVAVKEVQAKQAGVEASGASKMDVTGSGSLGQLDVNVSGSSKYLGPKTAVDVAKVEASGVSRVELMALALLEVKASGASSINYSGKPQLLKEVSGASRVRHIEED